MLRQPHLQATLTLGDARHLRQKTWPSWLLARTSKMVEVLLLWIDRASQRAALAELEDQQLADIGRSRAEARRECAKPFWRA